MAKNWTVAEAVVKIKENDFASIKDIGGRFALFEHLCAKAIAGDGEAFVELMSNMPEYVTVGKIEKVLKSVISGEDEAEDAEPVEEKVEDKPKRGRGRKKAEPVEEDNDDSDEDEKSYEDMTAKELFDLCKSRKIKVEPKQKASVYIKLLKAADAKAAKANEDEDDDDWGDDEEVEEKKPAKKAPAKTEKKVAKKPEPKDDDDDSDWDI